MIEDWLNEFDSAFLCPHRSDRQQSSHVPCRQRIIEKKGNPAIFVSLPLDYSNIKNTAAITEVLTLKFADGLTTLMNYIRSVVNHSNLCYS